MSRSNRRRRKTRREAAAAPQPAPRDVRRRASADPAGALKRGTPPPPRRTVWAVAGRVVAAVRDRVSIRRAPPMGGGRDDDGAVRSEATDDDARDANATLAGGARARVARAWRRLGPWGVSLVIHAALVVLGLLVTWTVASVTRDRDPVVVTADFQSLAYEPIARLDQSPIAAEQAVDIPAAEPVPDPTPPEPIEDLPPLDLEAPAAAVTPVVPTPGAVVAPSATTQSAAFVGLTTSNARRIVYVLDASGSMIRTLPIVLDELQRSIERLSTSQEYGIVFFQRNDALVVPPAMAPARPDVAVRRFRWIDEHVVAAGRSNPLRAIEVAIDLRPDVIFLLSENITGSGEFEIDANALLQRLDELNPKDGSGRRAIQINCIQFLDPDPLRTLERIAAEHGGERGYKFLDRAELGLNQR